ncbi:hypothetical protein [Gemmobacter sp. 24YEA27]|uniref:hypothetical protein n=1 Tax=Gemmobacter sp. 24YEA27 TaxID=3040672 RepID=UPI0024B35C09|nr:hypothetical protein [Gemmobacter sp. 24YEA27]
MLLCETLAAHAACAGFRSGNTDALAALLRDLAGDDARLRRMALAAPAAASLVSLAPDTWADRLDLLYASMLHRQETREARGPGDHRPEAAPVEDQAMDRANFGPGRGHAPVGHRHAMKG